jgi:hypothetical protein
MSNPPLNGLARLLNAFDRKLRRADRRINRSHVNEPRRLVRAAGHARWDVILAVPVIMVLVLGPTLGWRGPIEHLTRAIAGCEGAEEEREIASVWRWICEDDVVGHARAWGGLLKDLGVSAAAEHPKCGSKAAHGE